MVEIALEIMSPNEAARWFRRSLSWLRRQRDLLRLRSVCGGQPLYHIDVCRAYVLGQLRNLKGAPIHLLQLSALEATCGLRVDCFECARRRRRTRREETLIPPEKRAKSANATRTASESASEAEPGQQSRFRPDDAGRELLDAPEPG